MHVETRDWRPGSQWDRSALGLAAILAGLVTGSVGLAFLTLFILADIGGAVDALLEEDAEEQAAAEELEPEVIEAGFVQLGREFRPRELPDRAVPTSSTSPRLPDPNLVSKRIVNPVERDIPPPNAYEDLLQRLGNTTRETDNTFAAETEGEATGTEDGSRAGDVYLGQLIAIFKRGWQVPVTIPDSELVRLRAAVSFRITEDLRMEGLRLIPSGNADYDRSIEQRLDDMRESSFRVPPPPPEARARYIGTAISFNMLPPPSLLRDARERLDREASESGGSSGSSAGSTDDALDRLGSSPHGADEPAHEPEPAPAPAPEPSPSNDPPAPE